MAAIFDDDGFLVILLHVRQRLGQDAGLVERADISVMRRISLAGDSGAGSIRLAGGAQSAVLVSRLRTGGKRRRCRQRRRGHTAASASTSQLKIISVPPVGAASGNRPWPAYCRNVRSPANSAARDRRSRTPATMPIPRVQKAALEQRDGRRARRLHETAAWTMAAPSRPHRRRCAEAAASTTPAAPITPASTISRRNARCHELRSSQQARHRGAQLGHAVAAARRGHEHVRKRRRMFGQRGLGLGDARLQLGGLHLVGLGQHDLVAHRGAVERLQHVEVDVLQAVARVDQHIDAREAGAAEQEFVDQLGPGRDLGSSAPRHSHSRACRRAAGRPCRDLRRRSAPGCGPAYARCAPARCGRSAR